MILVGSIISIIKYNSSMTIAVIGAGASGMAAALQAAWQGASVTLFERNPVVGKKLLVTGSGHCNLTNDAVCSSKYTCADPVWLENLLDRYDIGDLREMLAKIGILIHETSDGWYYPLSNSAQSVVEAFSFALNLAGVKVVTQTQVVSIKTGTQGFIIGYNCDGKLQEVRIERVVVSAGGTAYPALGSKGELFPVLEELGLTVLPKRPALAPVVADLGNLRALKGMRLDVEATLWSGNTYLGSSKGNLIFTEWGLNGPAVMDLSQLVDSSGENELSLNLLAFFQEEFDQLLAKKRKSVMPVKILLDAFFAPKVADILLHCIDLAGNTPLNQVEDEKLEHLVSQLKGTRLHIKGVRGFEYCQLSAGGVPVNEVDPQTLESRQIKGLYLTGETLDVVGLCGGYNLHFAFASGALAGKAAAGSM